MPTGCCSREAGARPSSTSTTGRRRAACRSAIFYFVGVIFGVSAGIMLLYDLFRVVSGQASEADLVAVKELEEH